MKAVYLLSGQPGTGKTSLIKQLVAEVKIPAGGFYTEEIREQGVRKGFKLVTLDGKETVMAHININSPYRVGKYGVDVASLEQVGVSALEMAARQSDLVVVDEIGKMELLSPRFQQTIWEIIGGGKRVLGSIMLTYHPWADKIKRHPRVNIITLTRDNHQLVREEIRHWLSATDGNRYVPQNNPQTTG